MHSLARRSFTLRSLPAAMAIGLGLLATAHAADWPERPIKLVVPYPPGGLTDVVSRAVSDEAGKILGTTIVVENKPGAGGQIGLQSVLQAPRDGYTIALVVPATMVTLPLTSAAYKIKPLEDFEPITVAVDTSLTLVTDRKLGFKTLADFRDYARKNPGKLNYGTPGAGTSFHFNNIIMAQKLGIQSVHVPYNGEMQVLNDVAGGQLQYALVSSAGRPFVEGNKVTALAVAGRKRQQALPDVPTFRDAGIDFASDGWVGFAAPAGTPAAVLTKLNEAFVKALNTPAVNARLVQLGFDVVGNSRAEFRTLVQEGTKHYGDLVRSGAIKVEN